MHAFTSNLVATCIKSYYVAVDLEAQKIWKIANWVIFETQCSTYTGNRNMAEMVWRRMCPWNQYSLLISAALETSSSANDLFTPNCKRR